MKRMFLIVALLLVLGASFSVASYRSTTSVEVLQVSRIGDDDDFTPRGYARLHDKESGAEILCFRDADGGVKASISCVTTGRVWK